MDQCHAFKSQSTKQLTTLMRALLIQWMILKGFDYFHLSFLCRYALLSFTRLQSDILLPNNLLKIYVFKKFSFEFCINSRYFLFHWRKKIFNICGLIISHWKYKSGLQKHMIFVCLHPLLSCMLCFHVCTHVCFHLISNVHTVRTFENRTPFQTFEK